MGVVEITSTGLLTASRAEGRSSEGDGEVWEVGVKSHCILTWSQFSERSPVFTLGGEKLPRAPWC